MTRRESPHYCGWAITGRKTVGHLIASPASRPLRRYRRRPSHSRFLPRDSAGGTGGTAGPAPRGRLLCADRRHDMADLTDARNERPARRAVAVLVTSARDGLEHLVADKAMAPGNAGRYVAGPVARCHVPSARTGIPRPAPGLVIPPPVHRSLHDEHVRWAYQGNIPITYARASGAMLHAQQSDQNRRGPDAD